MFNIKLTDHRPLWKQLLRGCLIGICFGIGVPLLLLGIFSGGLMVFHVLVSFLLPFAIVLRILLPFVMVVIILYAIGKILNKLSH